MKIHVRIQEKTFEVNLSDIHSRPIQVSVDGEVFEVWPEEMLIPSEQHKPAQAPQVTHPVKAVELDSNSKRSDKASSVTAPIPGVIIDVKVNEGDAVKYGQELCTLEAMKMKNSIRAGYDGIIAKIHVSSGEQVQQGKVLMEFREKADQ